MFHMDISKAKGYIDTAWSDSILPQLVEYVRIPNKSPIFDREWEAHPGTHGGRAGRRG